LQNKQKSLKTLFHLQSDRNAESSYTLLLEIGKFHCCYAFYDATGSGAIDQVKFISYEELESANEIDNLLQELIKREFNDIVVSSSFPEALLVPQKIYKNENGLLNVIYDQPAQHHFHDVIQEWQVVTSYSMPQKIYQAVMNYFPAARYFHTYTPTIKVYNGNLAELQLRVHFTPKDFIVLVKKEQQIQLVQTYTYETALDVVYYLLKVCYELQLPQSEVQLVLSGLIEKESGLYMELQNYFNVQFVQPPSMKLPGEEHPHYFFSSMYNLAACV
jgi:hypothetical protein